MPYQLTEQSMPANAQSLIDKIKALPAECIDEVEDFVDFITTHAHDRAFARATAAVSTPAVACIWDNTADDAYDAL